MKLFFAALVFGGITPFTTAFLALSFQARGVQLSAVKGMGWVMQEASDEEGRGGKEPGGTGTIAGPTFTMTEATEAENAYIEGPGFVMEERQIGSNPFLDYYNSIMNDAEYNLYLASEGLQSDENGGVLELLKSVTPTIRGHYADALWHSFKAKEQAEVPEKDEIVNLLNNEAFLEGGKDKALQLNFDWMGEGWETLKLLAYDPTLRHEGLRQHAAAKYSSSIPTEAALNAIMALNMPVLEIGGSLGYWSKLLSERGVDVTHVQMSRPSYSHVAPYFPIAKGSFDVLSGGQYNSHALLLAWPEPNWVEKMRDFGGDKLIYVGEAVGKEMAMLEDDWKLDQLQELPTWPGYEDHLWIYTRK